MGQSAGVTRHRHKHIFFPVLLKRQFKEGALLRNRAATGCAALQPPWRPSPAHPLPFRLPAGRGFPAPHSQENREAKPPAEPQAPTSPRALCHCCTVHACAAIGANPYFALHAGQGWHSQASPAIRDTLPTTWLCWRPAPPQPNSEQPPKKRRRPLAAVEERPPASGRPGANNRGSHRPKSDRTRKNTRSTCLCLFDR